MTTTTNAAAHRSIVSLKLSKKVPALITQVGNIVQSMSNNPSFPSPSPARATVSQATGDLQTAETATLSRTKNEPHAAECTLWAIWKLRGTPRE